MSANRWSPNAPLTAQVSTVTVTGYDVTTTYTISCNGKSVSVLGQGGTAATTAVALLAALQGAPAASYPEFAEVAWTNPSGAIITATANTPGKNFTFTSSVTGGAGTIGAFSTTTANGGPSRWGQAANWSAGRVPAGSCVPPVQANAAALAGGSLVNGTPYFWVITATNPNGETTVSNEKTLTPAGGNLSATLSWAAVANATGYKVYRSTASNTYGATSLVAIIGSGATLTYADTGTALTSGQPPVGNGAIGDDVYIDQSGAPILYDLDQTGVILNSLSVAASFANVALGLPEINTDGSSTYLEYRKRYLTLGVNPGVTNLGYGPGQGAALLAIDFGTVQANVVVEQTGSSAISGLEPCQLKGTNAGNVLTVARGDVAFCGYGADVGALATLNVAYVTSPGNDAAVRCGPGATVTTLTQAGGTSDLWNAPTTLTLDGSGAAATVRNGSPSTTTIDAGTLHYTGTGTLTSPTVGPLGVLDFTQDPRGRVVSGTAQLYAGATWNDPLNTVGAFALHLNHCRITDVTIDTGLSRTYALS